MATQAGSVEGRSAVLWACLLMFLPSSSVVPAAEPDLVRCQFREADTLFANPGQGWMSEQRRPRGEPRFPCSVVYIRFNWAEAEPAEGQFNWKLIDDVIAAWKRAPVVFEWFGDYKYLQSRQWSVDAAVNFMLSNHVTLINDNIGAFPPEAKPQLERLAAWPAPALSCVN